MGCVVIIINGCANETENPHEIREVNKQEYVL